MYGGLREVDEAAKIGERYRLRVDGECLVSVVCKRVQRAVSSTVFERLHCRCIVAGAECGAFACVSVRFCICIADREILSVDHLQLGRAMARGSVSPVSVSAY